MDTTRSFAAQRMRGLHDGALGVAIFLFLMVPWRLTGAPGPGPMRLLAGHAGVWGLLLLLYAFGVKRLRLRVQSAEWPALGFMLVGLGVTGSQLWLYGRLQETAAMLIVSMASGFVLDRRAALAAFQATLLLGWGCLAVRVGGLGQAATWVFDIVLAGLFAFSIQHLRARSLAALVRRIRRQRRLLETNAALVRDLQEALQNIQTLSGLIPICAQCKKIRNDQGYWEQVESYLCAHSEVQFTHGICPGCATEAIQEWRGSGARPQPTPDAIFSVDPPS